MKQSRMDFNLQILVMIHKNPSSMHREYHEFYAVHVYLRSIRISLVYMHIYFKACSPNQQYLDDFMRAIWKHWGLVISGWYFRERRERCRVWENVTNRKGWWNIFNLLSLTTCLHPPTKIPVLKDPLSQVKKCMHVVIQVEQFHYACYTIWYTSILLLLTIIIVWSQYDGGNIC